MIQVGWEMVRVKKENVFSPKSFPTEQENIIIEPLEEEILKIYCDLQIHWEVTEIIFLRHL